MVPQPISEPSIGSWVVSNTHNSAIRRMGGFLAFLKEEVQAVVERYVVGIAIERECRHEVVDSRAEFIGPVRDPYGPSHSEPCGHTTRFH